MTTMTADLVNYLASDFKLDPVPALFPIAGWEGQSVLQLQGQLTYNNNTTEEMNDR